MNRRDFVAACGSVPLWANRSTAQPLDRRQRPTPSPAQLLWQRDELALFLHFGVNTFTDREWGDGREDPALFNPTRLDAREWARIARRTGFKAMILTAKHHDGFCLWPSTTTRHSVASSPWRGGSGDLVREFTDACRAEGLRAGLYLSPWDRNAPSYGDSPRYSDLYCDQLTELLTRYGAIHEVWFDGANGEGPNGRRQVYDWPRYWGLVKRLQPDSVIFSDAGPDVRWIGNEIGSAGDPCWSTVDPTVVPYPGMEGEHVIRMLQHGDPRGTVWRPGETDVSIRPGWFHHPAQDAQVKTPERLLEIFFTSVGRNSKLLLNVPPTRDGVIHEADVASLTGFQQRLRDRFNGGRVDEAGPGTITLSMVDLRENIERGQAVARYRVEGQLADGGWQVLSRGETIGYRKLDRFPSITVSSLRFVVEDRVGEVSPVSMMPYR